MNLFSKNEGCVGFNSSLDSKPEIKSGLQFLTFSISQWVIFNKILRVMKLTFILLIVLILKASAEGFSQKVTYSGENVSLETVFTVIKKQTGYGFFFQEELFALAKPVTINASNEELSKVLVNVFKNQPLDFSIKNKTILVTKRAITLTDLEPMQGLNAVPVESTLQKDIVVKGVVTDSKGVTLPGVSVKLKGTNIGASTDLDGKFSISLPDGNGILVISYIGFTTQEVAVNQRTLINIKLEAANTALTEVVVTALGIKRQSKSLGYATTNVSAEELTVNRTTNFMNALQGKVAGVNITPMGTGPAGTSKIRIRGQSSFGGNNSPLIVVNGVPIDNTNYAARGDVSERGSNRTSDGGDGLGSINPDDIENMTVLKGAAASALYGSRAKDGVIMITTKSKGSDGVTVSYNSNYTTDKPLDYTDYQSEYGQGENGVRPTTPFLHRDNGVLVRSFNRG
jgi:TonB-dependent SusC/RagA subfamily outer membrane receptor